MRKLTMAAVILGVQLAPPALRLDTSAAIPFFIDDGKEVSGYHQSDRELAKLALNAWSRESGGRLNFTEVKTPQAAVIRFRWISPSEGLYGETQRIQVNGKTGAVVNVMPQVSVQGEPLATRAIRDNLLRDTIVYLTCVHELGHAIGLSHTSQFDDIMYFFGYGGNILEYFLRYRNKLQQRADIGKYSGLSPGDVQVLRRLYN